MSESQPAESMSDLTLDSNGEIPLSRVNQQWKFKSSLLGMDLEADEALKLQQELTKALKNTTPKGKPKKINVPTRLLEPTSSIKHSIYQKPPPKEIDPREAGFVLSKDVVLSPSSTPRPKDEPEITAPKSTKKVKQTSSHLVEVVEHHKFKPTSDPIAETMKKLSAIKPIDPNNHLLQKPKSSPKYRVKDSDGSTFNDSASQLSSHISGSVAKSNIGTPSTPFLMKSPRFGKELIPDAVKMPKPITGDSHLLRTTRAVSVAKIDTYKEFISSVPQTNELSEARKLSMKSGPKNVESKLLHITASLKNAAYVPKGPSEEEIAEKKWEEEQAKKEHFVVAKPSERLLLLTTANQYSIYKKPDDEDEIDDSSSHKVVEVSPRLLQLTTAAESNLYKAPEPFPLWQPPKDLNEDVKIGKRLLAPTQSYELSKYHKPEEADVDVRELGWKPIYGKKEEEEELKDDNSYTASEAPTLKVKETSERLLSLTAAQYNRLKSAIDEAAVPVVHVPKPVQSTEHFLKPTESFKQSVIKQNDDVIGIEGDHSPKSSRPIPPSLLATTASYENRLKNSHVSDTESIDSKESGGKDVHLIRPVGSERFLAPTASFVNRLATVDETKPLTSPLSSSVRPVSTSAHFLEPTASSQHRKLSLTRQDSVGNIWIDALSVTSSRRSGGSPRDSGSIISRSTVSSISVKSLVKSYETSGKVNQLRPVQSITNRQ